MVIRVTILTMKLLIEQILFVKIDIDTMYGSKKLK
jgi:hypothetical protein